MISSLDIIMDLDDSSFATPQLRLGPTSRLLKRRSQAAPAGLLSPRVNYNQNKSAGDRSVYGSILGETSQDPRNRTEYEYDIARDMTLAPTLNFTSVFPGDLSRTIVNADETTYGKRHILHAYIFSEALQLFSYFSSYRYRVRLESH